jgi:hypothetical protein
MSAGPSPPLALRWKWAGFPNTDYATIQSWLTGKHWPRPKQKDAILKVFFREPKSGQVDDAAQKLRQELEDAWQEGRAARGLEEPSRDEDSEPEAPKRWLPDGTSFAIKGLALVRLAEPQPGNEPGSGWQVKARLRIDPAEYEQQGARQCSWPCKRRCLL